MIFSIWLENRKEFDDIKAAVLTSLFSELEPDEAEASMEIPLSNLDQSLIDEMLKNQEVIQRLSGRDPNQFIKSRKGATVNDFIEWLIQSNNPMAVDDEGF